MNQVAWLPAAAENRAYEGIRRGEEPAFRAVAQPLQPVLRRVVRVIVPGSVDADAIILRSWASALRGLPMFRWRMPLATWVAQITVAHSRAQVPIEWDRSRIPEVDLQGPANLLPGPVDWSDLPWGARWEAALATLTAAFEDLPLAEREVVYTRDVERWTPRQVCDVLGLPEAVYQQLLGGGRSRLRRALASLVGEPAESPDHAAQVASVVRLLNHWVDEHDEPLDPRALQVFRQWRAGHVSRWRRLSSHLPHRRVA